jgi:D-alanyl-D-alanine carboxypeptidase
MYLATIGNNTVEGRLMSQQPHQHHTPHADHSHHPHHRFMSHHKALVKQEHELTSLHPFFRAKVNFVLLSLKHNHWQPFVYQGKTRTPQQAQENVQKRTGINKSWHRPDVVGLLGSNQVVQLYAADIVDERWGWEGPAKDLNHQFWNDLGRFAKAAGLEWGGDWKKPRDVAHVQMAVVDSPPARSAEV